MTYLIKKRQLQYKNWNVNALLFIPNTVKENIAAVFTHGYTAQKNDVLTWASKLAEVQIPCIIYDLPGHYLGSFNEVLDFEEFKNHIHELPLAASNLLKEEVTINENSCIIVGGHSLGGFISLKSLNSFDQYKKVIGIGVGLGLAPLKHVHIFDTPFFKATLDMRRQLVSEALCPENVFPWIRDEKPELPPSNKLIYLLTGLDDIIVTDNGTERLAQILETHQNEVKVERPKRLPHYQPEHAATFIKNFLKTNQLI